MLIIEATLEGGVLADRQVVVRVLSNIHTTNEPRNQLPDLVFKCSGLIISCAKLMAALIIITMRLLSRALYAGD